MGGDRKNYPLLKLLKGIVMVIGFSLFMVFGCGMSSEEREEFDKMKKDMIKMSRIVDNVENFLDTCQQQVLSSSPFKTKYDNEYSNTHIVMICDKANSYLLFESDKRRKEREEREEREMEEAQKYSKEYHKALKKESEKTQRLPNMGEKHK